MHIISANLNGNPNVGLFCYATDKYCLIPDDFPEKLEKDFKEALKVPLYKMRAAGTELLGVFFAGNNDTLLVPEIMFDSELKKLDELKIKYHVVKSELTALGNNMIVTDKMIIANPDYDDDTLDEIKNALKIKVKTGKVGELNTVGSLTCLNTMGCLVSPDIKDFEKKFLTDNLKLKITTGTANFGSPYVNSSIVANSNGFIVGDASGGPEVQNMDIALGFLEE